MTTPLRHHNLIKTRDVFEAREEVARVFCPHELTPTSAHGQVDVVHNGARVGKVGLNYLRYGDEVRIRPGTLTDFYLVQIPIAGRARVRVGDTLVASDKRRASLPSPDDEVDMIWSDGCEQLIVYLDRSAVERCASAQMPSQRPAPVIFHPSVCMDSPGVRSWMRLIQLMREELENDSGLLHSELASSHLEQLIIGGLLAAQPNSAMDASQVEGTPVATTRAVKHVLDLIESQPEQEWRVADLADSAGVSARTLQEGFRRERGVGPMEALRRTRLARAHEDLLVGSPGEVTVTDTALRWGFVHLGRFSAVYRDAYHEAPSQTLARG